MAFDEHATVSSQGAPAGVSGDMCSQNPPYASVQGSAISQSSEPMAAPVMVWERLSTFNLDSKRCKHPEAYTKDSLLTRARERSSRIPPDLIRA